MVQQARIQTMITLLERWVAQADFARKLGESCPVAAAEERFIQRAEKQALTFSKSRSTERVRSLRFRLNRRKSKND